MDPSKVKQIVYRFNADPSTDETVEDLEGEITVPERGDHQAHAKAMEGGKCIQDSWQRDSYSYRLLD